MFVENCSNFFHPKLFVLPIKLFSSLILKWILCIHLYLKPDLVWFNHFFLFVWLNYWFNHFEFRSIIWLWNFLMLIFLLDHLISNWFLDIVYYFLDVKFINPIILIFLFDYIYFGSLNFLISFFYFYPINANFQIIPIIFFDNFVNHS